MTETTNESAMQTPKSPHQREFERQLGRNRLGLRVRDNHPGIDFVDGVAIINGKNCRPKFDVAVCVDLEVPASYISGAVGKPIRDIVQHPLIEENFWPASKVTKAWFDPLAEVTLFEASNARKTELTRAKRNTRR